MNLSLKPGLPTGKTNAVKETEIARKAIKRGFQPNDSESKWLSLQKSVSEADTKLKLTPRKAHAWDAYLVDTSEDES